MTAASLESKNFFNKDNSLCLKGIMCALILCHHLYQFTAFFFGNPVGFLLTLLGEWAVSVFLFISGFGLISSYLSKGDDYLNGFIKRRFIPLYLKYLGFVLIYFIADFKSINSYKQILTSLTFGSTIVSFGWFFPLIFAMYLGFFAIYKLIKTSRFKIIALILFWIAYMIVAYYCYQRHLPVFAFAFGCLTAYKKETAQKCVSKHPLLLMAVSFLMFFSYYVIYILAIWSVRIRISRILYDICAVISYIGIIIFAVTVTELFDRFNIPFVSNRLTRWLGIYSLEIYAIQGLVLRKLNFLIENRYLYAIISTVVILVLAYIINLLYSFISSILLKKHRA